MKKRAAAVLSVEEKRPAAGSGGNRIDMEKSGAQFNPDDPTHRALMDALQEQTVEAQRQYFEERFPNLLNYAGYKAILERRLATAQKRYDQEGTPEQHRVVFCDFKRLKEINDQYGHGVGDQALEAFVNLLTRYNPEIPDKERPLYLEDFLAQPIIAGRHRKGDEFVLILSGMKEEEADRFLTQFKEEVAATNLSLPDGKEIPLTVDFGFSDWQPGKTFDQLLKESDEAMYAAKQGGKGNSAAGEPESPSSGESAPAG
jgi:GGDEF domain-containing protein